MNHNAGRVLVYVLLLTLAYAPAALAIVKWQVDDFQDGTTMGWREGNVSPNPPTNVADGGPAGVGDSYVQNISSGSPGAGGRWVMFSNAQWTGNYLATSVSQIDMDLANFGASARSMRIAIEGDPGQRAGSANAEVIPADGQWHHVTFGLSAADLTVFAGASSVSEILANVTELRILVAGPGPSWFGDQVAATLGADNITAGPPPVPTVSEWGLAAVLLSILTSGTILLRRQMRVAWASSSLPVEIPGSKGKSRRAGPHATLKSRVSEN